MKHEILLSIILLLLSGCLQTNLQARAQLETLNCTYSQINVQIQVKEPAQVKVFTSEGSKELFVEENYEYSYLVENEKKTERVLVTSGGDEYQTVVRLPQCACLLVNVQSEWAEPTLTLIVTGMEESTTTLTANDKQKTVQVGKGETKRVNFTLEDDPDEVKGEVTAIGRCEQNFRYSISLEKTEIAQGNLTYSIGKYVQVEKELRMRDVTNGFAINVGANSGNITVLTDGVPNTGASIQQNTLNIPGEFEELKLTYAIAPTPTNGRLVFSDQAISQDPSNPIDISVEFKPGYAPYYYDPQELELQNTEPLQFTTQAETYKKLITLAYGPQETTITLVLNTTVTALGNGAARLEILSPQDTNLQTVQAFQISQEADETYQENGETYYVYEWTNLTEGDTRTLQIQTQILRRAGLFTQIQEPLQEINQTSPYWNISSEMIENASSLVGDNDYQTVYNVIEHVKNKIEYERNTERKGAASAYSSGKGACDEYADTVITILRYLDLPAAYTSGYTVQQVGEALPGRHGWVKILDAQRMELEPQELPGALDTYRIEYYTEYGAEKSPYRLYGDVTLNEKPVAININ